MLCAYIRTYVYILHVKLPTPKCIVREPTQHTKNPHWQVDLCTVQQSSWSKSFTYCSGLVAMPDWRAMSAALCNTSSIRQWNVLQSISSLCSKDCWATISNVLMQQWQIPQQWQVPDEHNTQTHRHEVPAKPMCRHLPCKAGMHPDKMCCSTPNMVGLQQHTLKMGSDDKSNSMNAMTS